MIIIVIVVMSSIEWVHDERIVGSLSVVLQCPKALREGGFVLSYVHVDHSVWSIREAACRVGREWNSKDEKDTQQRCLAYKIQGDTSFSLFLVVLHV